MLLAELPEVSALPLIDPALLEFFWESLAWPLLGFCIESGELVCGVADEGVWVCWVVVDEVVEVEPFCWSVLLLDCATAKPAPSKTTEAV